MKLFAFFMARGLVLGSGLMWTLGASPLVAALTVTDADARERRLDEPGRVTVVIYSNPALQDWTRRAGASLDRFQGLEDFRLVVVVDLRKTMADWATGYTIRRMQKDLDKEAERMAPFFRAKGNPDDPRSHVSAVADFKGGTSLSLGWTEPANRKRVLVFGKDGKVFFSTEDLGDFSELQKAVQQALAGGADD